VLGRILFDTEALRRGVFWAEVSENGTRFVWEAGILRWQLRPAGWYLLEPLWSDLRRLLSEDMIIPIYYAGKRDLG
jgi:hypothetical protein